jgi:hypothetical protein
MGVRLKLLLGASLVGALLAVAGVFGSWGTGHPSHTAKQPSSKHSITYTAPGSAGGFPDGIIVPVGTSQISAPQGSTAATIHWTAASGETGGTTVTVTLAGGRTISIDRIP